MQTIASWRMSRSSRSHVPNEGKRSPRGHRARERHLRSPRGIQEAEQTGWNSFIVARRSNRSLARRGCATASPRADRRRHERRRALRKNGQIRLGVPAMVAYPSKERIELRPPLSLEKWLRPSGLRQQISPSRIALRARTPCAISSASCGQDLNTCPLREINSQRCPRTCASARNPSIFASKMKAGWSNGSDSERAAWE
jgi:hypothetical protein